MGKDLSVNYTTGDIILRQFRICTYLEESRVGAGRNIAVDLGNSHRVCGGCCVVWDCSVRMREVGSVEEKPFVD